MPGGDSLRRRENAIAAFACMVGGLILARAVNDNDLSDRILKIATRGSIDLTSSRRGKRAGLLTVLKRSHREEDYPCK